MPPPRVFVTLCPNSIAPKTTNKPKSKIDVFLFIIFVQKDTANDGAMPLAPILIAKNITIENNIIKINISF